MAKHKLNVRKVEGVIARGEVGRYGDGAGLYLEVTGPGVASWLYRYQLDGRKRMMGLGSASVFDLAKARKRAQAQRELRADGTDPITHKRAEKARRQKEATAIAEAKTFGEVARMFFDAKSDTWSKHHREAWLSSVLGVRPSGKKAKGFCDKLLKVPVADITKMKVAEVVKPIWTAKPTTASRVLSRIHTVLDHAIAFDLRPEGSNPADPEVITKLMPAVDRTKQPLASVPYAELPALFARIAALDTSTARALAFQILCAVRPLESYGARWSEVDLENRLWTIPAERMKGRVAHTVPLSDPAVTLLESLPREDDVVFVSSRVGRVMASNSLQRVMRHLGRREVPHGLRASFSTWASECTNFPDTVVEQCLAHKIPSAVAQAYKRDHSGHYMADKKMELLAAWGAFVAPRTGDEKVTTLRTAVR